MIDVRKSVVLHKDIPSPVGTAYRWDLRSDIYGADMTCVIYYVQCENCPECGAGYPYCHKLDCGRQ